MKKLIILLFILSACQPKTPNKLVFETPEKSPQRVVEYSGRISDEVFVIYGDTTIKEYYSSFGCIMGKDSLREYPVLNVLRERDGGSTIVIIEDSAGSHNKLLDKRVSVFSFPVNGPFTFNNNPILITVYS